MEMQIIFSACMKIMPLFSVLLVSFSVSTVSSIGGIVLRTFTVQRRPRGGLESEARLSLIDWGRDVPENFRHKFWRLSSWSCGCLFFSLCVYENSFHAGACGCLYLGTYPSSTASCKSQYSKQPNVRNPLCLAIFTCILLGRVFPRIAY